MARIQAIFLLVAFGLVAHCDGLRSNLKLALYRMLKHEVVADPAELAWHVILFKPIDLCGGSIVSSEWVLTAAHCVHRTDPSTIVVMPLAADLESFRSVSSYVIHDHYDAYSRHNDVALVRVSDYFQFSGKIKPIALSTSQLEPGAVGRQVKFCLLEDGRKEAIVRNRTVMSTCECEAVYGAPLPAPAVCASGSEPPPAGCDQDKGPVCFAEAGGALVAGGLLVAVETWSGSWNHPATNTDVYVDVAYLHAWVEQVCAIWTPHHTTPRLDSHL